MPLGIRPKYSPSIVDVAPGDAGHDLVTFGYLILDDRANVREGNVFLGDLLLVALATRLLAGKRATVDEVRGEKLV